MAIYKSSFNQKPEKEKKESKPAKIKVEKEKPVRKSSTKINGSVVCLVVFSILFLLCLFPNIIRFFVLGMFGLSVYPVCVLAIFFSTMAIRKRQIRVKSRYLVYLCSALIVIWFIFHLIMTKALDVSHASYGAYLSGSYQAQTTAGGLIFSLITYPIVSILSYVGAYIFAAIALAIFVGLIIDYVFADRAGMIEKKTKFDFKEIEEFENGNAEPIPNKNEPEYIKHEAKRRLGLEKGSSSSTVISSNVPVYQKPVQPTQSRPQNKREYILTPIEPVIPPEESGDLFLDNSSGYFSGKKISPRRREEEFPKMNKQTTMFEAEEMPTAQNDVFGDIILDDSNLGDYGSFVELDANKLVKEQPQAVAESQPKAEETKQEEQETIQQAEEIKQESVEQEQPEEQTEETNNQPNDWATEVEQASNLDENNYEEEQEEELESLDDLDQQADEEELIETDLQEDYVDEYSGVKDTSLGNTNDNEIVRPSVDISKFNLPNKVDKSLEIEQVKLEDIKPKEEIPPYVAPRVDMLENMPIVSRISEEKVNDNVRKLEQVLEDFKVPAKVNNVTVGPAVTRYELSMPRGISVNKISQMADDIAMTLASNGAIRVEAPIPGKNSVGVEVPNDNVTPVSLREVVDSNEFRVRGNPLSFVLGKDINGDIIFCNLDKMPHLLVAGSTGSGKSVCLNTMLLSICYKSSPEDVRFILVDPKMVEFYNYNGLPHLLIPEVITGKEMTINAFDWAIKEMEARYALFAKNKVVNINEYNKLDIVKNKKAEKLPFIVIVVDELADLMLEAKRELEDRISKIAAKSRAAGIHLVLATQRPSVDVITGVIKNNLPSRIAFALTTYVDSKTILDSGGAEKLLGKGDMLFKVQGKEARRVQGAFVSSEEINKVIEFIKKNNKAVYDSSAERGIKNPHQRAGGGADTAPTRNEEFDPILKDVLRMFIETQQASGSMIQRRYSVGFNRAGRIIEQMERAGFISPANGSKPRQVLITMAEFKAIFGDD